MKNEKDISETMELYHVLPFALAALLISFFQEAFFLIIWKDPAHESQFQHMAAVAILAGPWILWAASFFRNVLSVRYFLATGRNYAYDSGRYHKSYTELMEYFRNAEPHKLDTSVFPEGTWHDTDGLIFGMDGERIISIPSDSECNIAVFGPPGSGKTSGIAIINAMRFQGSVLAVDIKGDLYSYVHAHSGRKIIQFAPDAPDALEISCSYDPLAGYEDMTETEKKLYVENMATVLIPDEGGSEGSYFSSRARKLFQGITHLVLHKDPGASFPDIIHAILESDVFTWVNRAIEGDCAPAKELMSSFYGNNEKNVSGAYDAMTTALVPFSNAVLDRLLARDGKTVSIKDLEDGCDIYLQISQEHLDSYAPLFTLLLQSFSTAFTRRPDKSTGVRNRQILMLLDEFPQLTFSYKMINSDLSTLRSKSVVIMVIQQNMSQLEYRYRPDGARSIIGNCSYQVILGSNDITSSKVFSEMFGDKKVLRINSSVTKSGSESMGTTVQESEVRVFPPEYFGDLSSRSSMILYFKGKYAELRKLNCYRD